MDIAALTQPVWSVWPAEEFPSPLTSRDTQPTDGAAGMDRAKKHWAHAQVDTITVQGL